MRVLDFPTSSSSQKSRRRAYRPNFNINSGLTLIGRGLAGERPGSAPESNAAGSARASRPALRGLFAPGTRAGAAAAPAGSGGLPADIDAPAATLHRPGRAVGVVAAEVGAPGPAAGVEAEASSRPGTGAAVTGPDLEPDIVPSTGSVVQVLAAADRSRTFTASPPAAGLVAGA